MAERIPTSLTERQALRQTSKLLKGEKIEAECPIAGCNCVITDRAGYGVCRFAPQSWNYIYPFNPTI